MQDLCRWVYIANSLNPKSFKLSDKIESVKQSTHEIEAQINESRKKIEKLIFEDSITILDFTSHNSQIHLFTKLLYRKRKDLIISTTNLILKSLKCARFTHRDRKDTKLLDICVEIIRQIHTEKETPKSYQESIKFAKLKKRAEILIGDCTIFEQNTNILTGKELVA